MNSCRLSFISLLFRLFWLFITFHFISFQPKGNISAKEFFIFYFSFSSPLFRSPSLPSSSLVLLFFSFLLLLRFLFCLYSENVGVSVCFFFRPVFFGQKNDDTMRSRPRMAAAEKADQDFPPGAESYVMIEQLLLRGCKTTPMEINSLSVLAQGSSCE